MGEEEMTTKRLPVRIHIRLCPCAILHFGDYTIARIKYTLTISDTSDDFFFTRTSKYIHMNFNIITTFLFFPYCTHIGKI